jgi:transposase
MEIPIDAPKALLADKGYDGDRFRESLLIKGILPIIPPRSNRKVSEHPDYRRYRDRNRLVRMFGKLKHQLRIATRYDKTILSFESFLNLATTRQWLKCFVNTAEAVDEYLLTVMRNVGSMAFPPRLADYFGLTAKQPDPGELRLIEPLCDDLPVLAGWRRYPSAFRFSCGAAF